MRRALYILLGSLLVLLLLAIVLPFLFRDKVDALLKAQINRSLNATVDYQRLSLSFFRHFPALTVRLEELTVINRAPFEGDTLLHCEALDVGVDVLKALRGDIAVTRFYLIRPKLLVQVRGDGAASWDITLPDTTEKAPEAPDTAATAFQLGLRRYEIQDANLTYWDSSLGIYARLLGLTHRGKGDFTQDEVTLSTETQIERIFFAYDRTTYLNGQRAEAEVDLDISFPAARYTLSKGRLRLNDLPLEVSGSVSLPDSLTTVLDLRYAAPEASLKELLSFIPAAYKKGYESLSTEGTLRLEGFVRGELRDTLLPAFALKLAIEQGRIRYKDLPKPIEGLEVRLVVESPAATLESLQVALDTFSLRAGGTSLRAQYRSRGLSVMQLDLNAQGKGNLSEFASALPLGYEARGAFELDLKAQGTYAEKKLPSVQGYLRLREGYLKAADFPTPVEALEIDFAAQSPQGLPAQTTAELKRLSARVAGEPIEMSLRLQNLDALNYTFAAKGAADLGTWTRIFPIDSTELTGKITFDLATQGSRDALEKQDYNRLPTQGSLTVQNLSYKSPDLPQGLTIQRATLSFTPQYAALTGYRGTLGRSDIALEGRLQNYLGYALRDGKITGALTLSSQTLDLNEWMSSDTAADSSAPASDTTSTMEVVVVPANVDFTFQAAIGQLLYEKMVFRNAQGRIIVRDQAVRLEGFSMEGFGGTFAIAGSYLAPDKNNARWDMQFKLQQVRIEELASHFTTMRRLAPIVSSAQGQINLDFSASSRLKPDMMPDLATLSGAGLAQVLQVMVQGSPSVAALAGAAKLSQIDPLRILNALIRFKVQNGELQVEPFSFSAGEYKMEIGGVTRLDQSIAYAVSMEVPAGWAQNFLQAAGLNLSTPSTVRLIADLGGTVSQPKVLRIRPAEGGAAASVQQALLSRAEEEKARLEAEARRKKDSLEAALRRKEDSVKQALEQRRREEEERLRREAEERRKAEEERLRQEAERRRREEEERAKRQLEEEKKKKEQELKNKLPFPR